MHRRRATRVSSATSDSLHQRYNGFIQPIRSAYGAVSVFPNMRIFIDEAGGFLPPRSRPSSYSLVLALIVPSSCEKDLFYQFLRLRDSWPVQQIEIKGSSLDEKQASQLIQVLASFDVVVDFVAVDMALHAKDVVDHFKFRQADAITKHVGREHHPEMVFQLVQLERTVRNMPISSSYRLN